MCISLEVDPASRKSNEGFQEYKNRWWNTSDVPSEDRTEDNPEQTEHLQMGLKSPWRMSEEKMKLVPRVPEDKLLSINTRVVTPPEKVLLRVSLVLSLKSSGLLSVLMGPSFQCD